MAERQLGVDQAEVHLRRAVQSGSPPPLLWWHLGMALVLQGDEAGGRQAWQRGDVQVEALIRQGDLSFNAKLNDTALRWYTYAGILDPDWAMVWFKVGEVYRAQAAWDKALEAYRRAVQVMPDHRDSWYDLGQLYLQTKDWQAALAAFEQGVQGTSGEIGRSNLYYQIGWIQQTWQSPPDLTAAQTAYETAIRLDDYPVAGWQRSETYYQHGRVLAAQHHWAAAVESYEDALTIDPNRYALRLSYAESLEKLGQRERAEAMLQAAIEVNPNNKQAYWLLGNFYRRAGRLDQAREMYNTVLALDSADQQAREALIEIDRGPDAP